MSNRPFALRPRPPGRRTPCLLLAALLVAALAPAAAAQTVCVPPAGGVPALSGAPNWWDAAPGQPDYWPRPDDPRWRGAFLHVPMPASATNDHLTFRTLRTGNELLLQWRITVDPQLDSDERLRVAFSPGAGNPDVLIDMQPFNSPAAVSAGQPHALTVAQRTGANPFAGLGAPPAWINPPTTTTRVWLDPTDQSWTVNLRVPITAVAGAGIDLGTTFRFWFEVRVSHPNNNVVYYRYPSGLTFDQVENGTSTVGWREARRDLVPPNAACMPGVSLAVADVGTVPAGGSCGNLATTLSNDIRLLSGGSPASNTFCARPQNHSGGVIAAGDVDATFRIANWGTQPDWNSVPDPLDTLWTEINPTPATGGPIPDGGKGALSTTWNLSAAEVCSFSPQPPGFACGGFPAPTRRRHQCILVELNGGPGVTLTTSSTYRNMDFVNASTFRREAEVSVVGLGPNPAPGPDRDVYLWVQTHNMPARVGAAAPMPGRDDRGTRASTVGGRRGGDDVGDGGEDGGDDDVDGDGDDQDVPGPVEPLEKSPYEELRETEPTYQVHAFHDTGETEGFGGATVRILAPQTSFGYFVEHEGDLLGWRHELTGAQEISPDYYRIGVPEDGVATVTTVIEAIESRWSLSLHAGVTDPQSGLPAGCGSGDSLGVDLEVRFGPRFAAELFYGQDDLDCVDFDHLALNGKWYFGSGTWRPFVGLGAGGYDAPGSDVEAGFNLFAGAQWNLTTRFALEAMAKYHHVDTGSPGDAEWLAVTAGLRVRF